ncbi:helix-turn-helix domain-containing protein [Streptomyces sp. LRE541]|uniref:helix-turn-helix domain-containing protein n=1 Tax=Streptomyces sp. LRE541 TaxID=2931983 RepID=UPI00200F4353|nr:helix-turn-helix domain-containing protein [Streptomyces sp. LRE541]UPZ29564.1 helix-turn-helix domain-containing protein [Streptomyces sp. LRE541]
MLHESVLRTLDLPVADRFEAWTQRLGHTHAPMDLASDRAADYRGHQRVIGLGDVTVWPATFDHLVFRRTPKLVRQSDPEAFHLSLLLRGEGEAAWGRQQAAYGIRDFHINCSSRSYEITTGPDPVTIVGVEIPRTLVALPTGHADQAIGRRISGRERPGALLAQFLVQLAADTNPYRPSDAPRLGTVVADLVTAVFAHAVDEDIRLPPETHDRTLFLRVKAYVHRHLADPELTPARIAAAHHISRSHLYRLFQAENVSVAAYVRDRRLANAHRDLTDPALSTTPVHAVGARWGFPRAPEFTRAFRTAYGLPPGEFRRQTLSAAHAARPRGCGRSANQPRTPGQRQTGPRQASL